MKSSIELWVFRTALGWFALAGRSGRACWCSLGHPSRSAALRHARGRFIGELAVRDWNPALRRRLCDYAAGRRVTFDDMPLDFDAAPRFHRSVLAACRAIGYGETCTYAQLARAAGRPRAVRAAGSAMARNPLGILIPCHRVFCSDGGLGGYSAPQGISLKQRLLDMERAATTGRAAATRPIAVRRSAARSTRAERSNRLAS